ncbi:MAG: hypothetical protein FWH31_00205 [Streptococcaceae bacterium]|nr:hypothetical protein [Streptococcaceae bacterium]
MKAIHLRSKKKLEFWLIKNGNEEAPVWVQDAFTAKGFQWIGPSSLRIVNTGGLIKINASAGDFLVFNGKYMKIVTASKFKTEYRVLNNQ